MSANYDIFCSCGEASGEQYLSRLLYALREKGVAFRAWGMGGAKCRQSGLMDVQYDCADLQIMGIVEIFGHLGKIYKRMSDLSEAIIKRNPHIAVLTDSPDFHLPLAKKLRKSGYKGRIINLIPPTVWAWRSGRVKTLKSCMNLCLPLFPFEHEFLLSHGCASAHLGHPLLDEFPADENFLENNKNNKNNKKIAFLPGSRSGEIKRIAPALIKTAQMLQSKGYEPVFSVASSLPDDVRDFLSAEVRSNGFTASPQSGQEIMRNCACVVGKSGTSTLEAMLLRRPMVVAYKANALSVALARIFVKSKYFAQPNFLAQEEIYPEFLQEQATPQALHDAALAFLEADDDKKRDFDAKLVYLRGKLGRPGAYDFWADMVIN